MRSTDTQDDARRRRPAHEQDLDPTPAPAPATSTVTAAPPATGATPAARYPATRTGLARRLWPSTLRPLLRAPVAHVLRELRDQRSILIGVFLALPVLNLLAFWAFEDRLVEAPVDTAAGGVPPIALGLFLLAVVGDVFAGESRRGTLAFLRRLPGGMRRAFAAKLIVTLAGSVLTVVWQALLLWACWWLWNRSYVPTPGGVLHAALTSPLLLPVATVGAFVLLASTWLQHGGMAILLAPMMLGALLAPAVVWGRAHPVIVRWVLGHDRWSLVVAVATAISAMAILAAAVSFLGGRRVVRSAWSAAWRGLAVLLVLVGGAYAYGGWRIHEALDFRPGEEGASITKAYLGRGGQALFVEARHERKGRWHGQSYDALSRVWVVDVETGAMRTIGDLGETIERPPHAGRWGWWTYDGPSLEPLSSYVQRSVDAEGRESETWIDGASGAIRKVVAGGVRTPDIVAWMDEAGAEATRTRDAAGRRVWLRSAAPAHPRELHGRPALRVEGRDAVPMGEPSLRLWRARSHPSAWLVRPVNRGTWAIVDPETGSLRHLPIEHSTPLLLSPSRCLWHGWESKQHRSLGWQLVNLDAEPDAVLRPAPGFGPTQGTVVGVLDTDCVLSLAPLPDEPTVRRLCTWDPETGAHEPIGWTHEPAEHGVPSEAAETLQYASVLGHRGDGSLLLQVGWGQARTTDGNPLGVIGYALLTVERESRLATWVVPALRARPAVVAYEASGAVTVIEQGRRIVRWGPAPKQREVLFPR